MNPEPTSVRLAIAARESAVRRVRAATCVALAAAAALAGIFAALAAASTHAKQRVRLLEPRRSIPRGSGPVVAPAPALVQVVGAAPSPPPQSTPAPTPSAAPPVVVSGGS